jgi:nicotinamidase-related amidase
VLCIVVVMGIDNDVSVVTTVQAAAMLPTPPTVTSQAQAATVDDRLAMMIHCLVSLFFTLDLPFKK